MALTYDLSCRRCLHEWQSDTCDGRCPSCQSPDVHCDPHLPGPDPEPEAVAPARPLTEDEFNVFQCEGCKEQPQFDAKDLAGHLKEVHGLDVKHVRNKKTMVMHLDGRDFYQSNYRFDLIDAGFSLFQYVRNKRRKDDPMRLP